MIARRFGAASIALALLCSAAACTFLRSLDDLGDGVAPGGDEASVLEGGGDGGDASREGASPDGAPPVCGPEIDLKADPKNCNVCGRACLDDDACDNGACRFATTADEGAELAVGGGWLVYSDGNAIWARKTTGGDRLFVKDAGGTLERMTTDGAFVYWTTDGAAGGVFRCSLPTCANVETLAAQVVHPHDITLDGQGTVYWSNSGGTDRCGFNRPIGQITAAKLDGTSPRPFITSPTPIESVTDITQVHIRAPYMYWSTNTCAFDGGSTTAQIWRQPLAGGAPGVQLSGVGACRFLDLTGDDADLHYACEYTRVASTSLTPQSGAKQWSTSGLQFPRVASDGTRVYWTDVDAVDPDGGMGARYVYSQLKTNPTTTPKEIVWTKAKTNRGLRAIAVDDRWIYFADPDDRRIRAIPK